MRILVSQTDCASASVLCLCGGSRTTVIAKIFCPLHGPIFSPLGVILPTLKVHVLEDIAYLLFPLAPVKCSAPDGSGTTSSPKLRHRASENNYPRSLGWRQPLESPQNGQVSALACCVCFRVQWSKHCAHQSAPWNDGWLAGNAVHSLHGPAALWHPAHQACWHQKPLALSDGQAQFQVHGGPCRKYSEIMSGTAMWASRGRSILFLVSILGSVIYSQLQRIVLCTGNRREPHTLKSGKVTGKEHLLTITESSCQSTSWTLATSSLVMSEHTSSRSPTPVTSQCPSTQKSASFTTQVTRLERPFPTVPCHF